jgi:hypothetical protein
MKKTSSGVFAIAKLMLLSQIASATAIPTTSDQWEEVYNGYGTIAYDYDKGVEMMPKASSAPNETHAALTLAKATVTQPLKDFTITLTSKTEAQLRTGSRPNPWEVFWLFFNYNQAAKGCDQTNYLVIKPNGVEIGKVLGSNRQIYLYTKGTPAIPIGTQAVWKVIKKGKILAVFLNGTQVIQRSLALHNVPGAIGLYTEDARVRVWAIDIQP